MAKGSGRPFLLSRPHSRKVGELSALVSGGVLGRHGKSATFGHFGAQSTDDSLQGNEATKDKKEKHNVSRNEKKKTGIIP